MNVNAAFITAPGSGFASCAFGSESSSFTCTRKGRSVVGSTPLPGAGKTVGRPYRGFTLEVSATAVPVEVSEDTFEAEVLQSELPVLVDFYAVWCGPCKLVSPLMDWAAAAYEGKVKVVKVDTERNESFVKKYGIYGLPTFAVFIEGDAKNVQEGAMAKPALKQYVQKHAGVSTDY